MGKSSKANSVRLDAKSDPYLFKQLHDEQDLRQATTTAALVKDLLVERFSDVRRERQAISRRLKR